MLQTALYALYSHYEEEYEEWQRAGIKVPPVFIVVCNNTATSKLVYEWISGWQREVEGELQTIHYGHLKLFSNFDEFGNPLPRMNTLLIDSRQIEAGDALDPGFRKAAEAEIEQFRREKAAREGAGSSEAVVGFRNPSRSDEHGRQGGPPWRANPLRRLGRHAYGGLGHQHGDPYSRRARLRHPAPVRAGDRPCAATPRRTSRARPATPPAIGCSTPNTPTFSAFRSTSRPNR